MKNKIKVSFLAIIVICSLSCKKENPPVGLYVAVFDYANPAIWSDKTVWYKIEESKEDYFLIRRTDYAGNVLSAYMDTIHKSDKKIEGLISSDNNIPYRIKGEWSKKFLANSYLIKGDFTQTDYTNVGVLAYSGTFEIKSN